MEKSMLYKYDNQQNEFIAWRLNRVLVIKYN